MLGEDAEVDFLGVGPNCFVDGLDGVVDKVVVVYHLFEVFGDILKLILAISH